MNTSRIEALRKTKLEVDELVERINDICAENEKDIQYNVDNICKQIELDLEEIYKLTDANVYSTRHISFRPGKGIDWCYLNFDGEANRMFFIDTESAWGHKDDIVSYHIVLSERNDGHGIHYYEDGKWRSDSVKEFFASRWPEIKEIILKAIESAYKNDQTERLKMAMNKLNNSEDRLAKTGGSYEGDIH